MSFHYYTKVSREKIKLREKSFASGGEGSLYEIASPIAYRHLVAKIYHPHKLTAEQEEKMVYLVKNPPEFAIEKRKDSSWVIDLLYSKNKFAGILMHKISGSKLTMMCLPKLPRNTHNKWRRFAFGDKQALRLRMMTCFNIAAVVHQIHYTEKYVLVDLKPENILMQPDGLISIVDLDSVEVIEDGETKYKAPVATPEYSPAEHYAKNEVQKEISWDNFSMAVIFYQLLFGLHPFAASGKAPYDRLVSLHEKIKAGLWVHHSSKENFFSIIPPPHKQYDFLPQEIKELFQRCFHTGHKSAEDRPEAGEWCMALAETLNLAIDITQFSGFISMKIKPSGHRKQIEELFNKRELIWERESIIKELEIKGAQNSENIIRGDTDKTEYEKKIRSELNIQYQKLKNAQIFKYRNAYSNKTTDIKKEWKSNNDVYKFASLLSSFIAFIILPKASTIFVAGLIILMLFLFTSGKNTKKVKQKLKVLESEIKVDKKITKEEIGKEYWKKSRTELYIEKRKIFVRSEQLKKELADCNLLIKTFENKIKRSSFDQIFEKVKKAEEGLTAYKYLHNEFVQKQIKYKKSSLDTDKKGTKAIKEDLEKLAGDDFLSHYEAKGYRELVQKIRRQKNREKKKEEIAFIKIKFENIVNEQELIIKKQQQRLQDELMIEFKQIQKEKQSVEEEYAIAEMESKKYREMIKRYNSAFDKKKAIEEELNRHKKSLQKIEIFENWERDFEAKVKEGNQEKVEIGLKDKIEITEKVKIKNS